MPAFSRLSTTNSQLPRSTRLRGLARTLVLMSAAMGLVGLADSASTHKTENSLHTHLNTPQHWQEMKLDEYLLTYPNGEVLTLSQYAEQLPHPFPLHCGIGKFKDCQIPSYASLRDGPDWWIVTSTINWNYYTNFLASTLAHSGQLAKDVIHRLLHDLVYEYNPETSLGVMTEVDLIRTILYPIEHGGNRDHTVSDRTEVPDWMAAISPIATNTNPQMDLHQTHQTIKSTRNPRNLASGLQTPPSNVPLIVYNSAQPVETNLRQLSSQLEHLLAQSVENKVNSPISLDTGIYSAIAGGRFVGPSLETPRLASNADDIMRLIGVSAVLNHQNSMIVIRKSSCSLYRKQLKQDDETRLQFCASDSTLIEIVNVKENTIIKDIYNAHIIESKYGFKTSFLASEALRCQQANQETGHHQERENNDDSPFDVCTFELPICNLQDEYYQELLEHGKSIARICREDVGLPI
ncbi:uncharacterized protein PGTG_06399 [Puccinia graminis f. sp. tritici CRL 75-36-700-3]|uniref:DUF7872 domain-containing protein n=1 Tax=Puccinia graminis f. sp. tritici (strain CRL 75-36-700-3 / race SCCL) TaxID=418459 RepID=E3K7B3_PUCGT|nr:uncharacterized protein PGTG_06399 [Puccinia graminis f. sp. tritici CRL 75-36-700-3]EFP80443.1 hypothetical protein PGTG_06399 [Puccinia graminis f. sp. tritici CRL 75-36-700-3]